MKDNGHEMNLLPRSGGEVLEFRPKKSYYMLIWCLCQGRQAEEMRDILHAILHRAGGRKATRRLTAKWARGDKPFETPVKIRARAARRALVWLDHYCEAGLIRVSMAGTVMG